MSRSAGDSLEPKVDLSGRITDLARWSHPGVQSVLLEIQRVGREHSSHVPGPHLYHAAIRQGHVREPLSFNGSRIFCEDEHKKPKTEA